MAEPEQTVEDLKQQLAVSNKLCQELHEIASLGLQGLKNSAKASFSEDPVEVWSQARIYETTVEERLERLNLEPLILKRLQAPRMPSYDLPLIVRPNLVIGVLVSIFFVMLSILGVLFIRK